MIKVLFPTSTAEIARSAQSSSHHFRGSFANNHQQKIVIAGAGAVGSYYGGLLALEGHDVHFLARGDHLWAMRQKGLRIQDTFRGLDQTFPVRAVEGDSFKWHWEAADLVLLTSKTQDIHSVLDQISPIVGPNTLLLSLQNGIESELMMSARFGDACILGGLCYISAQMPAPGFIHQTIEGKILFGELTSHESLRTQKLAAIFSDAGIVSEISSNIKKDLWEKFAWNVPFNQMAAIGDMNVGQLLDVPAIRDAIREVMEEVRQIALVHHVVLSDDLFDRHMELSELNRPLIPSLLQDARKGKPTEHDTFGGFIVREGRKYGIPTPYNQQLTHFLDQPTTLKSRSPRALQSVIKAAKRSLLVK